MHVDNLKTFCDLVTHESFSKAAKLNKITQSAVSQQLRAMEKHFGIQIINRAQKQFRLTLEGQRLYSKVSDMLHIYNSLVCELQEMKQVLSGSIHVSTIYSIGLHELPPYVKSFLTEFPNVNIKVEYRRWNQVYDDLLNNHADIGLVAYPEEHPRLEIIPFQTDNLIVVCSPEHALANRDTIGINELSGHKLIGFDRDIPTRQATDLLFKNANVNISHAMEFDNIETVKRAVEVNAGIAVVPENTVAREVGQKHIKSLPIEDCEARRPLAIVYLKDRPPTAPMKQFIKQLTSSVFSY